MKIKNYLLQIDVKFILVWFPSLFEIKNKLGYEKIFADSPFFVEPSNFMQTRYHNFLNFKIQSGSFELKNYCNVFAITLCDFTELFNEKENSLFFDNFHFGATGNLLVANELYKIINSIYEVEKNHKSYYYEKCRMLSERLVFNEYFSKNEVRKYLNDLEHIASDKSDNSGSIVMNATPFTNGHLYLVEQAVKQVDHLYIFVVEEVISFFKFKDRIKLVIAGVSHLKNVTVLPSGNAIISSITMPGYFTKESDSLQVLDASQDIAMFGNLIAPAAKITK